VPARLRVTANFEAAERLLFLTMVLAQHFVDQTDRLRRFSRPCVKSWSWRCEHTPSPRVWSVRSVTAGRRWPARSCRAMEPSTTTTTRPASRGRVTTAHLASDPGQEPVLTILQHLLVRRALPLIDELARQEHARYAGLIDLDDLRSTGKLALYAAVIRFDDAFGVDFDQFARWYVYGAMLKAVRHEARHARVKRAARHTMARLLAYYTDDYNLIRDDDAELQRRLDKFCDNLAAVMFAGGVEEATRRRPDVACTEREEYAGAIAMLQEVVADLDEPEERMLTLLFREELTLHEVASRLSISYQATWLRNTRLLKRLRDKLSQMGLTRAPLPMAARLPTTGPPGLRLITK